VNQLLKRILIINAIILIVLGAYLAFIKIENRIQHAQECVIQDMLSMYVMINDRIDEVNKQLNRRIDVTDKNLEIKSMAQRLYTDNQVSELPMKEFLKQKIQEQRLIKSTVFIYNKTHGSQGSGVTIKYKGEYYIISAGHMLDDKDDILTFGEGEQEIGELEILAWEYPDFEDNMKTDLLLTRPQNRNLRPKFYVEIAEYEPKKAEEISIVGNPMGIEDLYSTGRIIDYQNNFMYFYDHVYFGTSGGGVFNRSGELVGIVSHLIPIQPFRDVPAFMIHGAVRINSIKEMMESIE
jgi:hypothetical protein